MRIYQLYQSKQLKPSTYSSLYVELYFEIVLHKYFSAMQCMQFLSQKIKLIHANEKRIVIYDG